MRHLPPHKYLFPISYRAVVIGDSGVGKSCLLDKFLNDSSTNNFISTIGVDIRTRETVINNKKVKVTIVEPGGAKKQKSFRGNACEGEALTSSQMSEESVELTRFSDTKKMQRESL